MSKLHRHKQRCFNGTAAGSTWIIHERYLDELFGIRYRGYYVCSQYNDDIESFNITTGPFKTFDKAKHCNG